MTPSSNECGRRIGIAPGLFHSLVDRKVNKELQKTLLVETEGSQGQSFPHSTNCGRGREREGMVKPIGKLSDKIYAEVTESLQRRLCGREAGAGAKREQASIALTNPRLVGQRTNTTSF